jgi:hypothetical protein
LRDDPELLVLRNVEALGPLSVSAGVLEVALR